MHVLNRHWIGCLIGLLMLAGLSSRARAALTVDEADQLARMDFRATIRKAKEQVFPAVVFIKVIKETHEGGKKSSQEIVGSGVLITPKGELLTNWHVVDKAREIRCLLLDGSAYDAKLVGSDKDTDLALVQLQLPSEVKSVPYARMGDSTKLKEGDFVMAMGAPWGLSRSVSIGIISCTRRFLPKHSEYSLWLQTDAAISPGNSGGPLVNTDGEVVGINTRGIMIGGDTGFSIPSQTIQMLIPQIHKHGKFQWSWTGLQLQPIRDFNRNIYFDATDGVIVAGTDPDSPAARAGIQANDRIVLISGRPVSGITEEDLPAVRRQLGMLPLDKPAELVVDRDGKTLTFKLDLREKGKVEGAELDCPRWDFTVKGINQFDNPGLYFHRKQGVFVYGIKYFGNARGRLQTQDILLKIDGREMKTLGDVKKIHARLIANVKKKHRVVITLLRSGLMRMAVLDFSRDFEKE